MGIWIKQSGAEIEINNDDGNIKAALGLGWKLKGDDLLNDPEKGNGEPGTMEWHMTAVKGMSSTEEIQNYMTGLGIDMNATGNLRSVKKAACKLIEEARQ